MVIVHIIAVADHLCREGTGSTVYGAEWWEAASAIGTVGATIVALLLAYRSWRIHSTSRDEAKVRSASLVSGWVETSLTPNESRSAYLFGGIAHLANESDRPVFAVHVVVGLRDGLSGEVTQLGTLSIPDVVWTLPSRHSRSWDITMGLMAMTPINQPARIEPLCRVMFDDVDGVRWMRDWDGTTAPMQSEVDRSASILDSDVDRAHKQMGETDNVFNPMNTARLLWEAMDYEDDDALDIIPKIMYPPSWPDFGTSELEELRSAFDGYGLATHIRYSAPRICYAMFPANGEEAKMVSRPGLVNIDALFITMVWLPTGGWKVHSAGGHTFRPDWIPFPEGALTEDPRG